MALCLSLGDNGLRLGYQGRILRDTLGLGWIQATVRRFCAESTLVKIFATQEVYSISWRKLTLLNVVVFDKGDSVQTNGFSHVSENSQHNGEYTDRP